MPEKKDEAILAILVALVAVLQVHIENMDALLSPARPSRALSRLRRFSILDDYRHRDRMLLTCIHLHMKRYLMEIVGRRHARECLSEYYVKPRSLDWWNHFVKFTRVDDVKFRELLHMPLSLFHELCALLHNQMRQGDIPASLANISGRLISVEKQVAIGVLRLASGTRIVELSDSFGVGKSTVVKIVNKFYDALLVHRHRFLSFPSDAQSLEEVKLSFNGKHGLPNCCGTVGVTRIVMDRPQGESPTDWRDRNSNFSMCLQAVVDGNMRFLDVFVGRPGSTSDSRLLRNSTFYHSVERGELLAGPMFVEDTFNIREYIIGDAGYGLHPWLMVPYDAPNTEVQEHFNFKLSSACSVTERAFNRLKMKWQYLNKKISTPNPKNVMKAIVASCMLHNMLLQVEASDDDESFIVLPSSSQCVPPAYDTSADCMRARDHLAEFLA